jgi:hypothetical protein
MFNTFYALKPIIADRYGSRLRVIFRQHIQPWHPSSTLTHEAGAAVLKIAPEKFWDFSSTLFKHQAEFFDISVVNETRNKTYERLAHIADTVGVDKKKVLDLLIISEIPGDDGQLNVGNQVTNDIKWMVKVSICLIVHWNYLYSPNTTKADRVVGVHVSPTIFFNVRQLDRMIMLNLLTPEPGGRRTWHQ